jgi:hypothetical protein
MTEEQKLIYQINNRLDYVDLIYRLKQGKLDLDADAEEFLDLEMKKTLLEIKTLRMIVANIDRRRD